jgi:hypothetical protein
MCRDSDSLFVPQSRHFDCLQQTPDRHSLRDSCLLKWLIMAVSAVSGPAFVILDYKCSGKYV